MGYKLIKELLVSESFVIAIYSLNTGLICLIFGLRDGFLTILYPLLISITLLLIYLGVKLGKLTTLNNELANYKIANYKTNNVDPVSLMYNNLINEVHNEYLLKLNDVEAKRKRNEELLSQFFHNMKTSVAVIELAANSNNETKMEDIITENDKLKLQLEHSLNVLRLEQFIDDYMPKSYSLQSIVNDVINENKSQFIYNEIYPRLNEGNCIVFTDQKWLKYLLHQLVSNAIKYSNSGSIVEFIIDNEDGGTLTIKDYGIGIKQSELNRVFDLFYTGSNGRNNSQSTGIGLNMVKTVSKMLDIDIEISSQVGVGTTIVLKFPSSTY